MAKTFIKLSFAVAFILALMLLMPATARADFHGQATETATESAAPTKQVFVGQVQDSQAFIGLTITGTDVTIFVCDGTKTSASYWHWFTGKMQNDTVDITATDGEHVTAQINEDTVTGTVTLNDKTDHTFSAETATAPAGMFRTEFTIDGVDYVGGWITMPDGQQRGGIADAKKAKKKPLIIIIAILIG